jgi:hypothetical protein
MSFALDVGRRVVPQAERDGFRQSVLPVLDCDWPPYIGAAGRRWVHSRRLAPAAHPAVDLRLLFRRLNAGRELQVDFALQGYANACFRSLDGVAH